MFIELRQYRTRPGKRDEWVKMMEEVVIPFQASKGMVVLGSFVAEGEEDLYIWMRRFEDEAERERLYKAVYESDEWQQVISPQVGEMLDRERTVVTRIVPTIRSVMR